MLDGRFRDNLKSKGWAYAIYRFLFPEYLGPDVEDDSNHWGLMIIVFGGPVLLVLIASQLNTCTHDGIQGYEEPAQPVVRVEPEDWTKIDGPSLTGIVPSDLPEEPAIPQGAIDWNEAGQHVGEVVTVFGPVAGASYASESNGAPTFINMGAPYPDEGRVSIVIWGENRSNFPSPPETMYSGKTICVTGEVYVYGNACNIEAQSPSQIEVVG